MKMNLLPRNITKIIQIITACAPTPGFNILTSPLMQEEKMCPHLPTLTMSMYPLTSTAVSEVNNFIPHPLCISLRFSNKHFLYVRVYLASFNILTQRSFLNYSLSFRALCYTLLKLFHTRTHLSAAGIECKESLWCSSQSLCCRGSKYTLVPSASQWPDSSQSCTCGSYLNHYKMGINHD